VLVNPFFLLTHSKKHFLTIQFTDADGQGKFTMIHMDKGNARDIVATAEAETGRKVERSEEKGPRERSGGVGWQRRRKKLATIEQ
jgi:hypothetical protein